MPRKALRVKVELNIEAVTCPGTFLRERDDVYLSICLLGYQRKTICVPPVFPLLFHQILRFERTFTNCMDPAQLSLELDQEHVLIEVIQLQPNYEGGTVLAYYECSARDFLYPDPLLSPSYSSAEREILFTRTLAFKGISPKLEFSCSTVVRDSSTPTLDELRDLSVENSDDDIVAISRRSRPRRRRVKSYEDHTISSRVKSPSLKRRQLFDECTRHQAIEDRPPFVVRRQDTFNHPVSPSKSTCTSPLRPLSAPLIRSRSASPRRRTEPRRSYWSSSTRPHRHYFSQVTREPEVLSNSDLSDETEELISGLNHLDISDHSGSDILTTADLITDPYPGTISYGRLPSYRSSYTPRTDYYSSLSTPRYYYTPRSLSPVLSRSSIMDRYGDPYVSPTRYDRIHDRIEKVLRKARSLHPY